MQLKRYVAIVNSEYILYNILLMSTVRYDVLPSPEIDGEFTDTARYIAAVALGSVLGQDDAQLKEAPWLAPVHLRDGAHVVADRRSYDVGMGQEARTITAEAIRNSNYNMTTLEWREREGNWRAYLGTEGADSGRIFLVNLAGIAVTIAEDVATRRLFDMLNFGPPVPGSSMAVAHSLAITLEDLQAVYARDSRNKDVQAQIWKGQKLAEAVQNKQIVPQLVADRVQLFQILEQEAADQARTLVRERLEQLTEDIPFQPRDAWLQQNPPVPPLS